MEETIYYPQDEMTTMLIPVTSGCPYNRCAFCSMYQGVPYEVLPVCEMERLLMVGDPYTEKVFLTGADPLSIGFEALKERLEYPGPLPSPESGRREPPVAIPGFHLPAGRRCFRSPSS